MSRCSLVGSNCCACCRKTLPVLVPKTSISFSALGSYNTDYWLPNVSRSTPCSARKRGGRAITTEVITRSWTTRIGIASPFPATIGTRGSGNWRRPPYITSLADHRLRRGAASSELSRTSLTRAAIGRAAHPREFVDPCAQQRENVFDRRRHAA